MSRTISYKKLNIRSCLSLQLIKIPVHISFRILEKFGVDRTCFDGVFINHFLHLPHVQLKIVFNRKISNENFGFHFRIIDIIPAVLFGIFHFGKIRIVERITASGIKPFVFRVRIFQPEVAFGFWNRLFSAGKQYQSYKNSQQIF